MIENKYCDYCIGIHKATPASPKKKYKFCPMCGEKISKLACPLCKNKKRKGIKAVE